MGSTQKITKMDLKVRDNLLNTHPILEREYCIPTPMLKRTYAVVRERVWAKRTGVYFYGSPRLGKSTCALETAFLLMQEFPNVYAKVVTLRKSLRPSESHVFRLILEAENHQLSGRPDPYKVFQNVLTDILMQVHRRSGKQYVLICDEIQLLNDVDFTQLLALHNALAINKVKMTTVSFGQPEILHKVSALFSKKQTQIIGRFLSEPLAFEGCSSLSEFRTLLETYDDESEYPEGSGWSYTYFFLPEAYLNNFRLSKYSRQIWEALLKAAGNTSNSAIPMEHLSATIEHILISSRHQDCTNFVLSLDEIDEAVDASNLKNFTSATH